MPSNRYAVSFTSAKNKPIHYAPPVTAKTAKEALDLCASMALYEVAHDQPLYVAHKMTVVFQSVKLALLSNTMKDWEEAEAGERRLHCCFLPNTSIGSKCNALSTP